MKSAVKAMFFLLAIIIFMALSWSFFRENNDHDIIISDRMSDFIDFVDMRKISKNKMVILFDLDDTVFMHSVMLGTPAWFYNMVNKLRRKGVARSEAYSVLGHIDRVVQEQASVVLVERATQSAIRRWQLEGAMVVALTSRPSSFDRITQEHLEQVDISFVESVYPCIEQNWDQSIGGFNGGVIYVDDNQTKGQVFEYFYELAIKCGMVIDLIAQADDQQRYVIEIGNFAKDRGLSFVGVIYGGALSMREFNIDEANYQLHELELILGRSIIPKEYRKEFAYNN